MLHIYIEKQQQYTIQTKHNNEKKLLSKIYNVKKNKTKMYNIPITYSISLDIKALYCFFLLPHFCFSHVFILVCKMCNTDNFYGLCPLFLIIFGDFFFFLLFF